MPQKPARTPSQVFVSRVREVRTGRGWDQADLASALADAGYPMDRSTIARLENEDRRVSLDDAMAISAVLGVSPLHMVVPLRMQGPIPGKARLRVAEQIALTPTMRPPGPAVRAWIRGERPLDRTADGAAAFYREVPDDQLVARGNAQLQDVLGILSDLGDYILEDVSGQLDVEGRQKARQLCDLAMGLVQRLKDGLDREEQR